jgi:hypothetical protein
MTVPSARVSVGMLPHGVAALSCGRGAPEGHCVSSVRCYAKCGADLRAPVRGLDALVGEHDAADRQRESDGLTTAWTLNASLAVSVFSVSNINIIVTTVPGTGKYVSVEPASVDGLAPMVGSIERVRAHDYTLTSPLEVSVVAVLTSTSAAPARVTSAAANTRDGTTSYATAASCAGERRRHSRRERRHLCRRRRVESDLVRKSPLVGTKRRHRFRRWRSCRRGSIVVDVDVQNL